MLFSTWNSKYFTVGLGRITKSILHTVGNVVKLFEENLDFPKFKKAKKGLFLCQNLYKNVKMPFLSKTKL